MQTEISTDTATQTEAAKSSRTRTKLIVFAAIVVASVAAAAVYTVRAVVMAEDDDAAVSNLPSAPASEVAQIREGPHLVLLRGGPFRYGRVGVVPPGGGEPALTDLGCLRVYYAAGSGLCLGSNGTGGGAFTFNANMEKVRDIDIVGLPSRVRVSPDGKYGSMTVFVTGHSYLDAGMSTRTGIVDMATGAWVIENLEDIDVYRDGDRFDAIDFNFWGVTFAQDSNRFYATLMSGTTTYLIEGDVAARRAEVLKENVECPSLSPDGTRLVYKKREGNPLFGQSWRLHVLDLSTMEDRPLAEERSVDDQVEWLDEDTIIYYLRDETPPITTRPDLWTVSVDDEAAEPALFGEGVSSPAFVKR